MLDDLLRYVRAEGRVCPVPTRWNELWEMLPERRRVGNGWDPPPPLILAAWWHSSALEKMLRLAEHIEYASRRGALEKINRYLRSLPEEEWSHLGDADVGR